MHNKKIELSYKIIMSFIALFIILQPGDVFSKTHLRDNMLTFKKQVFTVRKGDVPYIIASGALLDYWGAAIAAIGLAIGEKKYLSNIQISFIENDHCVTHNQPYEGVSSNKNALSKNVMHIKSGRKGSKGTAKCFLKWFKNGGATSFNHRPAKLNFAVKGKLIVTIPKKEGGSNTFTFDNMVFAQGHAGAANNWWVGGVNCTRKRRSVISCSPEGYKKDKTAICFNRPYDRESTIHLVSCTRTF